MDCGSIHVHGKIDEVALAIFLESDSRTCLRTVARE